MAIGWWKDLTAIKAFLILNYRSFRKIGAIIRYDEQDSNENAELSELKWFKLYKIAIYLISVFSSV